MVNAKNAIRSVAGLSAVLLGVGSMGVSSAAVVDNAESPSPSHGATTQVLGESSSSSSYWNEKTQLWDVEADESFGAADGFGNLETAKKYSPEVASRVSEYRLNGSGVTINGKLRHHGPYLLGDNANFEKDCRTCRNNFTLIGVKPEARYPMEIGGFSGKGAWVSEFLGDRHNDEVSAASNCKHKACNRRSHWDSAMLLMSDAEEYGGGVSLLCLNVHRSVGYVGKSANDKASSVVQITGHFSKCR